MGFEEYMKIGIADLTTRYGIETTSQSSGLGTGKSWKIAQTCPGKSYKHIINTYCQV
jgi:hypothetical protein